MIGIFVMAAPPHTAMQTQESRLDKGKGKGKGNDNDKGGNKGKGKLPGKGKGKSKDKGKSKGKDPSKGKDRNEIIRHRQEDAIQAFGGGGGTREPWLVIDENAVDVTQRFQ